MTALWSRAARLSRILLLTFLWAWEASFWALFPPWSTDTFTHSAVLQFSPLSSVYLCTGYFSCRNRTKCYIDWKWWDPRVELKKKLVSEDPKDQLLLNSRPLVEGGVKFRGTSLTFVRLSRKNWDHFGYHFFRTQSKINKQHSCGAESLLWKLFSCVWLFKMNFHQSFHGFWFTLVWL